MAELLKSLFKRIQDGASELGDAIHGDRIERGLDQDIRAIGMHLHQARHDAAAMKAQRIAIEDEVKRSKSGIKDAEAGVAALLARRRRALARQKAAHVVALLDQHATLQRECKDLKHKEAAFAPLIAQLEHKLRRAKHQLGTLRAASGIQRAQAAVAKLQPGPAPYPESAQASARRARQRVVTSGHQHAANLSAPRVRRNPAASDADAAIDALIGRLSTHPPAASTKRTTRTAR